MAITELLSPFKISAYTAKMARINSGSVLCCRSRFMNSRTRDELKGGYSTFDLDEHALNKVTLKRSQALIAKMFLGSS